jgi:hypothetical protein
MNLRGFDLLKTNCWRHSNLPFRLQTLYCDPFLDLSQIIKSQTELQILGMYYSYDDRTDFLGTFKQLQSAQLHLPVIVALEMVIGSTSKVYDVFNGISVFPAFNSIDPSRYPSIYQVLAESFDKPGERSCYPLADASGLTIYLVDSCDMSSIYVLTKNLAMRLPELQVTWLTFRFENSCKIVSFLFDHDLT